MTPTPALSFGYCERVGMGFWDEPANALTNLGFIIAGVLCLVKLYRAPREGGVWMVEALCWLIILIGIGSFLFHTARSRITGLMDVLPIVMFMLLAVYLSVRRYFRAPVWLSLLSVPGFIGLLALAAQFRCSIEGVSFGGPVGGPCFGGSVRYAPALLMLVVIGGVLTAMRHGAGRYLLAAGAVFALSLTARTLDKEICNMLFFGEYRLGLHWLWHLMNAVTLYLTAMAAIRHGHRIAPS